MSKISITNKIYNTLWGSSEVPENQTVSFLLSNLSYIALGIYLLITSPTGIYDEDRATRAWIIILVGFVSTVFHANQVSHGSHDHRTGVFHILDISTAIVAFLFAVFIRGIDNIPSSTYWFLVASIPFYLYNGKYYWLAHSVWHFLSAVTLFTILDY